MPQFKVGSEVVASHIVPQLDSKFGNVLIAFIILSFSIALSVIYDKKGARSALFQWTVKTLVILIVLCSISSLFLVGMHQQSF